MYVVDNGTRIIDKELMMEMFSNLYHQLLPFLEYNTHMYKGRTTYLVDKIRWKVVPYASLLKELFLPDLECNQDRN